MEAKAPIQKASTMAEKPCEAPSRRPTERPSLASPKPIALPRERSQIDPKKVNSIGPENQSQRPPPDMSLKTKASIMLA